MKRHHILVIDDEPGIRETLCAVLEDEGYITESTSSGEAGLARLAEQIFDCVLLDVWMPGLDGMEVLNRIQERTEADRPAVVMISGHATIESAVRATKLGAFDFLPHTGIGRAHHRRYRLRHLRRR